MRRALHFPVLLALSARCLQQSRAKLIVDTPLDTLNVACPILDGHQASHNNCSRAFLVSTTCVESWAVEREHLTQTIVPCPAGRPGMCTDFTVTWCNNSVYPEKGGCYRSEYAHTGLMKYAEYWFGFSLWLPRDYSVDVGSIHFQVHGNPNADVHEAHRNPMFSLQTDPKSGGNWQMLARGDPRRNITPANRTYEWEHAADLGPARLGEWEHFVYHTLYSHSANGFIELWRNGKQLVHLTETGTAYFDDQGPYFKFGIYASSWGTMLRPPPLNASTNVVVYGGLKQGDHTSSYSEVDTAHPSASTAPGLSLKTTDDEAVPARQYDRAAVQDSTYCPWWFTHWLNVENVKNGAVAQITNRTVARPGCMSPCVYNIAMNETTGRAVLVNQSRLDAIQLATSMLHEAQPSIKVVPLVGLANVTVADAMFSRSEEMISELLAHAKQYSFDGFNLDFEFAEVNDGSVAAGFVDRYNLFLTQLTRALHRARLESWVNCNSSFVDTGVDRFTNGVYTTNDTQFELQLRRLVYGVPEAQMFRFAVGLDSNDVKLSPSQLQWRLRLATSLGIKLLLQWTWPGPDWWASSIQRNFLDL